MIAQYERDHLVSERNDMKGKPQVEACTIPLDLIQEMLPHAGRWSLIQEDVIAVVGNDRLSTGGTTCFTVKTSHCEGHFPGNPVFPGVLLVELAGHVLGVVTYGPSWLEPEGKSNATLPYFRGCGEIKFRKPVLPEHTLTVTAKITNRKSVMVKGDVEIKCGEKVVAVISNILIAPQ